MEAIKRYRYDLIVVIPVYNEEESIQRVVEEWYAVLESFDINYRLLIINDGSSDGTREQLDVINRKYDIVDLLDKPNSGHGQTCIVGYHKAISQRAEWIFQIDSDGQCDPQYFGQLWGKKALYPAVFGRRGRRKDGFFRRLISFFTRLAVLVATGVDAKDANVPYRLMHSEALAKAIVNFPSDFHLANILVTVILQKNLRDKLAYVDIGFRKRHGGEASVKWGQFITLGWDLFSSLRRHKEYICNRSFELSQTVG